MLSSNCVVRDRTAKELQSMVGKIPLLYDLFI